MAQNSLTSSSLKKIHSDILQYCLESVSVNISEATFDLVLVARNETTTSVDMIAIVAGAIVIVGCRS